MTAVQVCVLLIAAMVVGLVVLAALSYFAAKQMEHDMEEEF